MDDGKQELAVSQEENVETKFKPAQATAETVQNVYEAAKNYTNIGKGVCERVEDIVQSSGVIPATGLDKHIPAVIDGIDSRLNKLGFTTETMDLTKRLQDYQQYFLSKVPEDYYQRINDTLAQVQESILGLKSSIAEKTPSTDDMKQLFEDAISKGKELVTAVLAIPGQDVFKSLPTSVAGAVEYIKGTPAMFQKDIGQVAEKEQVKMLISHLNSLVDSVKQVYGQTLATVTTIATTATASTTTTTTTTTTTITTTTEQVKTTSTATVTAPTDEEGRLC